MLHPGTPNRSTSEPKRGRKSFHLKPALHNFLCGKESHSRKVKSRSKHETQGKDLFADIEIFWKSAEKHHKYLQIECILQKEKQTLLATLLKWL